MNDWLDAALPAKRYRVLHETRYAYQSTVTLSQQYLHLTPRAFGFQQLESHQILCDPGPEEERLGLDYFGNPTRHVTITALHGELRIRAQSQIALPPRPGMEQLLGSPTCEQVRAVLRQYPTGSHPSPHTGSHIEGIREAWRYLYDSPHVAAAAALEDYARPSFGADRPYLEAVLDLTRRIADDFKFDPEATEISTPLDQVLKGRRGVCQDFAHLMIGCLRSFDLAARYMSGYILTHPPQGQPRLIGADASHAWVSVFCTRYGWVDFDPTNRCLVQQQHITLGWGRDYGDVAPLRGIVLGGGKQTLSVSVTVTPLDERK